MAKLFLGVLSGTSLDAINVGAFSFSSSKRNTTGSKKQTAQLHYADSFPIPAYIKAKCLKLTESGQSSLEELGMLDHLLGELFADAIMRFMQQYNLTANQIAAAGCHGQTIWHKPTQPQPFTMQIGDPNIIAAMTGLTIIGDFRRKDMAVGGQGAPLAPAFHAAVFGKTNVARTIVNIGGISNLSLLNKNVLGFDTGPGNCLLDAWTEQHFGMPYDEDGKLAADGHVIRDLLDSMLSDPYFQTKPPKSTGREYFNLPWLNNHLQQCNYAFTPQDVLATLVQLTSTTISNAIATFGMGSEVYVCGGGAYNKMLIAALQNHLGYEIFTTIALGIAPEWVEAGLFAWLAERRLLQQPGNLPSVTGASKAVVLGGVY